MTCLHLFVFLLLASCSSIANKKTGSTISSSSAKINSQKTLQTISFGSCNKSNKAQPMWSIIDQHTPDLWIWLGDIIYADTEDMTKMKSLYDEQKSQKDYQNFRSKYPVIGIWDDHDYGVNDGDKSYPKKSESQQLLLDFLDVPITAEARTRAGAYQSFTLGKEGQKVKIMLLDARYFRDDLQKDFSMKKRYLQNDKGTILGETQWKWLEAELTNSDAQIHLIACGIQMIPEEHRFEKWANFPQERQRLFSLLEKVKAAKTILLSGDRHIAEISKIKLKEWNEPIFEITSSGLTHSYEAAGAEVNKHRVGALTGKKNFGLLLVDWTKDIPQIQVEIRGIENELIIQEKLF